MHSNSNEPFSSGGQRADARVVPAGRIDGIAETGWEQRAAALTAVLAEVVHAPIGQGGDPEVAVMRAVIAALPGIERATLTRTRAHRPFTAAASDDLADQLDRWQFQVRQGPTLDALKRRTPVLVGDMAAAWRWPQLRAGVAHHPAARSVYCYPLRHAAPTAVLTLYSARPRASDQVDSTELTAVLRLVEIALAGLTHHARATNIERAMASNRRIGTAIGILVGLRDCTEEEAQTALALTSQALNRRIADIADDVVLTGTLPLMPDNAD